MSTLITYELVIYQSDGTTPEVTITSERGGTNPYLSSAPDGDGASFDPVTMKSTFGVYRGRIADWSIGSSQRVLTSRLEASGRQQLAYRKARLRENAGGAGYVVLTFGVLTRLELATDAEYEYEISDPMAAGTVAMLFAPAGTTSITTFLAAWPRRGCLIGGPIADDVLDNHVGTTFLGVADRGPWVCSVVDVGDDVYRLVPRRNIYGPGQWQASDSVSVGEDLADGINRKAKDLAASLAGWLRDSPFETVADAQGIFRTWPGLVTLVDGTPWQPIPNTEVLISTVNFGDLVVSRAAATHGLHVVSDGTATLSAGAEVEVRVLTALPTDLCPIYLDDHPVDLIATFCDAVGLPYSTSAGAALKLEIGAEMRYALRISSVEQFSSLIAEICCAFGIALRGNGSGEIEPFLGRRTPATLPTVTIDETTVVKDSTRSFSFDPTSALASMTFRQVRIARVATDGPHQNPDDPADQILETAEDLTFQNGDAGAPGVGTVAISTGGMIHSQGALLQDSQRFATPIAADLFDRFGRGKISVECTLLRGTTVATGVMTDDLKLGDHVIVDLPALPNANYRLGDNDAISGRTMQITRRTVRPEGYAVELVDSGPNASAFGTAPTLSIAASTGNPRTVATVTITNASTLNTASAAVRVQWATTAGATPASTDYSDVLHFDAGTIPTTAISLPAVAPGRKVYVRAYAYDAVHRFSAASSTANVTLTSIGSATSVSATADTDDGTQCALTWSTTGSILTTDLADIYVRLSADAFASAWLVASLPSDSTRFDLTGLMPSTAYIATVQFRDPLTGAVGTAVDDSFTTVSTAPILLPPLSPVAFSEPYATPGGSSGVGLVIDPGKLGLAVIAVSGDPVEFSVATETSAGSGTPGTYSVYATVPAVRDDWTTASLSPAYDSLKRYLRARHVRTGATASGYTTAQSIAPYTLVRLPAFPTATPILTVTPSDSDETTASFVLSARNAAGAGTEPRITLALSDVTASSGLTGSTDDLTEPRHPNVHPSPTPLVANGWAVGGGATLTAAGTDSTGAALSRLTNSSGTSGTNANYTLAASALIAGRVRVSWTVKHDGHTGTDLLLFRDTTSSTNLVHIDLTFGAGTLITAAIHAGPIGENLVVVDRGSGEYRISAEVTLTSTQAGHVLRTYAGDASGGPEGAGTEVTSYLVGDVSLEQEFEVANGATVTLDREDYNTGVHQALAIAQIDGGGSTTALITVPNQEKDTQYCQCHAYVVSSDLTTCVVQCDGVSATGTPQVELVSVTAPGSLKTGTAAGTLVASGTQWTFTLGDYASAGIGQARFRAVLSGFISDDDFVQLTSSSAKPALTVSASMRTVDDATAAADVTVTDPYPQGADTLVLMLTGDDTLQDVTVGGTSIPANALTAPTDFTDSSWIKNNVTVTANGGTAPDGTSTATKLAVTTTGVATNVIGRATINGTTVVGIMTVHTGTSNPGRFMLRDTTAGTTLVGISNFSYSNGSFTLTDGQYVHVRNLPNDWWTIILIATGATSGHQFEVRLGWAGATGVTAGDYLLSTGAAIRPGILSTSGDVVTYEITKPAEGAGPGAAEWEAIDLAGLRTRDTDRADVPEESVATIAALSVATNDDDGVVSITCDGDTVTGTSTAGGRYKIDAGSFTTFDFASDRTASLTIALSESATKLITVQAKNASDTWGPIATTRLPVYTPPPSIETTVTETSTEVSIGWTATGTVQYQIDDGGFGSPPSNPFTVTKNGEGGATQYVTLTATNHGSTVSTVVAVPPQTGGTVIPSFVFSSIAHTLQDASTDKIRVTWAGSGGTPTFIVETTDPGFTGDATGNTWGGTGTHTSPYDYTASEDLSGGILDPVTIGFRVRAISGSNEVGLSVAVYHDYGTN